MLWPPQPSGSTSLTNSHQLEIPLSRFDFNLISRPVKRQEESSSDKQHPKKNTEFCLCDAECDAYWGDWSHIKPLMALTGGIKEGKLRVTEAHKAS